MPRTYITRPPEERFWDHVNKDGPIPDKHPELGNCWLWVGSIDPQGYGHFYGGARTAKGNPQLVYPHRFAYGYIAPGLEISHRCEVENCVRRDHLEALSHRTNVRYGNGLAATKAAQSHCVNGHVYDAANTYIRKNGTRQCKACTAERSRLRHSSHQGYQS